jgi:hypothetical protein
MRLAGLAAGWIHDLVMTTGPGPGVLYFPANQT